MDAAVALQRKKTIKFLCIVDFPLSKQGIFFITLTQKAVAKMLPQLFLLYRTKPAKAMTDFQSAFYRDAQLLPGGWIFLLPTFSAAFRMLRQYRIILSADTASKVRQLPERCWSRKAEIVRYCLKFPRSRKPWSGSCPSCKIRNRAQNYSRYLQSGRKTGIIATVTCLSSSAG